MREWRERTNNLRTAGALAVKWELQQLFFRTFVAELEEAVRENSDDLIITASREMKTN